MKEIDLITHVLNAIESYQKMNFYQADPGSLFGYWSYWDGRREILVVPSGLGGGGIACNAYAVRRFAEDTSDNPKVCFGYNARSGHFYLRPVSEVMSMPLQQGTGRRGDFHVSDPEL